MKLALHHHYSTVIARELRDIRHDVVAAVERGWDREADDRLLALCSREGRARLTNNVRDFVPMAGAWSEAGQEHAGIVLTTDGHVPRRMGAVGDAIRVLDAFLSGHRDADALRDRVVWL